MLSAISASTSPYTSAYGQAGSGRAAANQGGLTAANAGQQLTPEEQGQVEKLKARDREVRQHEQAHMAAGAGLVTSGASFTYQRGPDGVNYAIGGEVSIATGEGRTPEETIQRARQIRAAALAPADPSGQDLAVAAQASQMEQRAQLEKSQQDADGSSELQIQTNLARAYSAESRTSASVVNAYA